MTCIDYQVWTAAQQACNARLASVKGFGYTATGARGLRGLGISIVSALNPMLSVSTSASSGGSPPVHVMTAAPVARAPTANPAMVAAAAASAAAANSHSGQPAVVSSPINTTGYDPSDACSIAGQTPCAPAPSSGSATAPPRAVSSGGFSHWGLLAALAVGGGALYLVMRKKS